MATQGTLSEVKTVPSDDDMPELLSDQEESASTSPKGERKGHLDASSRRAWRWLPLHAKPCALI